LSESLGDRIIGVEQEADKGCKNSNNNFGMIIGKVTAVTEQAILSHELFHTYGASEEYCQDDSYTINSMPLCCNVPSGGNNNCYRSGEGVNLQKFFYCYDESGECAGTPLTSEGLVTSDINSDYTSVMGYSMANKIKLFPPGATCPFRGCP
jgi:hypothetical protein